MLTLATRNELATKISDKFNTEQIDHIDQQGESDAAFLTRLSQQFNALATIKHGTLLFLQAGAAETVSGKPIAPVTITRQSGDSHRFSNADRNAYTGVKARWQDNDGATTRIIQVIREKKGNTNTEKGNTEFIIGSTGNTKVLRTVYSSKKTAERAAKSEWEKLQRQVATLSLTLAEGQPELFPEVPVTVRGFKADIDALPWLLAKVTHSISDSGYTCSLELEVKNNSSSIIEGI